MPSFDEQANQVVATFETANQQLLNPQGHRVFSDEVHAQRVAAARTTAINAMLDLAQQAEQEYASTAAAAEAIQADPTAHMSREELDTASARVNLVREELQNLSLNELYQRVNQAMLSNDRVSMYLWSRLASQRLTAVDAAVRADTGVDFSDKPTGGNRGAASLSAMDAIAKGRLEQLLPKVNETLVPGDIRQKAAGLRDKLAEIEGFKFKARQHLDTLNGDTKRHQDQMRRDYQQNF